MIQKFRFATLALLGAMGLALVPSGVSSQDLRYEMVTRSEFGGAVGRLMNAMPGAGDPLREATFIKGNRIRKDDGPESSTIMDWEAGTLTLLNHEGRSYVHLNLDEMAQAAAEAAGALEGNASEMEAAMDEAEARAAEDGEQISLDIKVSSERTGQTRRFSGYTAEQFLITLEIRGQETPGDAGEESESGGLGMVTELWLSTDFPEYRMMEEMSGAALERMRERATDEGTAGSMESLLTYDPRIKVALERNQETIDAMEGIALRTAIHMVTLPGAAPMDPDKVLAEQDRSLGDDAMDAAKSGAADAARSAVSNVTGRFFGRNKKEEEAPPEPEEPQQSVFMRIITEVSNVETTTLDADLFQPPAGYTLQTESAGRG